MDPDKKVAPQGDETTYEELYVSAPQPHKENLYTVPEKFVFADKEVTSRSTKKKTEHRCDRGYLCILAVLIAVSLAATICIIVLVLEMIKLESNFEAELQELNNTLWRLDDRVVVMQKSQEFNVSRLDERVAEQLNFINNTLLNNSISREVIAEDLLAVTLRLNDSLYQLFEQHTITSCADLPPSAPSGYYLIRNSSLLVYCDMPRTCGGVTGGWMRVFELDMTITSHQCPNGLSQRTDGGLRTCVRNVSEAGCSSIFLPTRNVNYSRVCGRITGYQIGTTDGFNNEISNNINSTYVDGVSLTLGLSPRQHIWTFESAHEQTACACQNTENAQFIPSFVGSHCFCDSGTQNGSVVSVFYSNPLWDANCSCCTNPPWFYRQFPQPTSDNIEMRVCRSEHNNNEDVALQVVEIYVQ